VREIALKTSGGCRMYGTMRTFPAPVEMYDGMHAQLLKRVVPATVDGLLVHIGRATTDGFQVLEVWESEEQYDRANTDIVLPLMRELAGDQPPPSTEQTTETFDVHGLIIPSGNIVI
jgi:predicted metal-binding protein